MAKKGTLELKAIGDASGVKKMTKEVNGSLGDMAGFAKKAVGAFAAFAVLKKAGQFMASAISAASDLNESMSKSSVVFGEASESVQAFAETASRSIGQSKQQALEAAGTFGNLMVSMGMTERAAATMSVDLVKLASDLASFNNTGVDEALEAIRSGLTGESEPMKRFGVNLNETALKAEALRLGLTKSNGPLDAAVKLQSAYSLMLAQTSTAQGDFARTSKGLANSQKTLNALWEDIKANLGQALLPALETLAGWVIDNMPAITAAFEALGKVLEFVADTFVGMSTGPAITAADKMAQKSNLLFQEVRNGTLSIEEYRIKWSLLNGELDKGLSGWNRLSGEGKKQVEAMEEVADVTGDVAVEFDKATFKVHEYSDSIDELFRQVISGSDETKKSLSDFQKEMEEQLKNILTFEQQASDLILSYTETYGPELVQKAIDMGPEFVAGILGANPATVQKAFNTLGALSEHTAGTLNAHLNSVAALASANMWRKFAASWAAEQAKLPLYVKAPIIPWGVLPQGLQTYKAYGDGGLITRPQMGIVGEAGAERILSAQQTAAFERLVDVLDRGNLGSTSYNLYTDQATMNAYSRQRSHALMGMG